MNELLEDLERELNHYRRRLMKAVEFEGHTFEAKEHFTFLRCRIEDLLQDINLPSSKKAPY